MTVRAVVMTGVQEPSWKTLTSIVGRRLLLGPSIGGGRLRIRCRSSAERVHRTECLRALRARCFVQSCGSEALRAVVRRVTVRRRAGVQVCPRATHQGGHHESPGRETGDSTDSFPGLRQTDDVTLHQTPDHKGSGHGMVDTILGCTRTTHGPARCG